MAIYFARNDQAVPVALVDGYLPDKRRIQDSLMLAQSFNYPGIDNRPEDSRYTFVGISQMINDNLKELQGSGIEHWVIYPPTGFEDITNEIKHQSPLEALLVSKEIRPKRKTSSPYCINVMADTKIESRERLKRYMAVWLSATGFQLKLENTYINFSSFRSVCQDALEYFQNLHTQPITMSIQTAAKATQSGAQKVS